jgi:LAO/AO transport system kinase
VPKAKANQRSKKPAAKSSDISAVELAERLVAGDRAILGRAITLIESRTEQDRLRAQELLLRVLPHAGGSFRIGVTGVPGVGKSTFIDTFGVNLTGQGHRVAVLAVDPTSSRTGGSILGDKTRMAYLSRDPNAFIRPSPSAGTLGGVTRTTREVMLLCEAAGYDIILVETVGVGQSEIAVSEMVDFFLVLAIAGAGDELQGIKRGLLELADMIAVNKADGDNEERALRAASDYASAMHIMTARSPNWSPPVVTCSALKNRGLEQLWSKIEEFRDVLTASGEFDQARRRQRLRWTWAMVEDRLIGDLRHSPSVMAIIDTLEADVLEGRLTPAMAADQILETFRKSF